jgi:hypothetical protein
MKVWWICLLFVDTITDLSLAVYMLEFLLPWINPHKSYLNYSMQVEVGDSAIYVTGRKLGNGSSCKVYVGRRLGMPTGGYKGLNAMEVCLFIFHIQILSQNFTSLGLCSHCWLVICIWTD